MSWKEKLEKLWINRGQFNNVGLYDVATIEPDQHWYLLAILILIIAVGVNVKWYFDIISIFAVLWLFEKAYNKGQARLQ